MRMLSCALAALIGIASSPSSATGLSSYLTPEQQALLGCGAFYFGADSEAGACHALGFDLMNMEGSVFFQPFPAVEVAIDAVVSDGELLILPGAHGPFLPGGGIDPFYDPAVDGCVIDDAGLGHIGLANGWSFPNTSVCAGTPNYLAEGFQSELEILSFNMMALLDPNSVLQNFVQALNDPATSTPEPGATLLFASIAAGAWFLRRKRRA